MLKRKLTLGLLVFMVGVLITACGSKKNDNSSKTNINNGGDVVTNVPPTLEDNYCANCTRTIDGTFYLQDANLYLEAFGYSNSTGNIFQNTGSVFQRILGEVAYDVLEPAVGTIVCGSRIFLTKEIAKIFGVKDLDINCRTSDSEVFTDIIGGSNTDYQLSSSYPAQLRVRYVNGRAEQVDIAVNTQLEGRADIEYFYYNQANIYLNQEQSLLLQNSDGRIRFGTSAGRVIGEFQ